MGFPKQKRSKGLLLGLVLILEGGGKGSEEPTKDRMSSVAIGTVFLH